MTAQYIAASDAASGNYCLTETSMDEAESLMSSRAGFDKVISNFQANIPCKYCGTALESGIYLRLYVLPSTISL
jgi:hypothetical protein